MNIDRTKGTMERNNSSRTSLEEFDNIALGISILVASFLVATVNVLMLIILWKNKEVRKNISPIIISLAVADFLVGCMMASAVLGNMGDNVNFLLVMLTSIFMWLSMLHLVLIAVDRCIAVMAPMWYEANITRRKHYISLAFTWILAIAVFSVTVKMTNSYMDDLSMKIQLSNFIFVSLSLIVLYSYLGRVACTQWRKIQSQVSQEHRQKIPRATKVLLAVLGAYIVLWGPYAALVLAEVCGYHQGVRTDWFEVSVLLVVCNSGVNFFIYALMNSEFRQAVVSTLKCRKKNETES